MDAVERPEVAVPTGDVMDVPTAPPQHINNDDGVPSPESTITMVGAEAAEGGMM